MVPGLGQIAILGLMDRRRCAGGGRKISDAGSGSIRGASPKVRSGFAYGKAGQCQDGNEGGDRPHDSHAKGERPSPAMPG